MIQCEVSYLASHCPDTTPPEVLKHAFLSLCEPCPTGALATAFALPHSILGPWHCRTLALWLTVRLHTGAQDCGVWQHCECARVDVHAATSARFLCELCRLAKADPFWRRVGQPLVPPMKLQPVQPPRMSFDGRPIEEDVVQVCCALPMYRSINVCVNRDGLSGEDLSKRRPSASRRWCRP